MSYIDPLKLLDIRGFYADDSFRRPLDTSRYELIRTADRKPLLALGSDAERRAALLIPLPPGVYPKGSETRQLSRAIGMEKIRRRFAEFSTQDFLQLSCLDGSLVRIFGNLVVDIAEELASDNSDPLRTVTAAIDKWRSLLLQNQTAHARERLIGLHGELAFLRLLATISPLHCLDLWKGPESHLHDFTSRVADVEVKTTLQSDPSLLRIEGLAQFQQAGDTPLYLYRVPLLEHPNGETLRDQINALISAGVPQSILEEKIDSVIPIDLLGSVDTKTYLSSGRALYAVDEDFPRIGFEKTGVLPRGVRDISFTIDLSEATRLSATEAEEVLRAILQPGTE